MFIVAKDFSSKSFFLFNNNLLTELAAKNFVELSVRVFKDFWKISFKPEECPRRLPLESPSESSSGRLHRSFTNRSILRLNLDNSVSALMPSRIGRYQLRPLRSALGVFVRPYGTVWIVSPSNRLTMANEQLIMARLFPFTPFF